LFFSQKLQTFIALNLLEFSTEKLLNSKCLPCRVKVNPAIITEKVQNLTTPITTKSLFECLQHSTASSFSGRSAAGSISQQAHG
jgi:hypothetical protein